MTRSINLKKSGFVLAATCFVAALFVLTTACQGSENKKSQANRKQDTESQQTAAVIQPGEETCGSLVRQTCERCHYLTRACQSLDKKKKRHWKKTIKIMTKNASQKGITISKDDQKKIIECLSSKDPEITTLCEEYR